MFPNPRISWLYLLCGLFVLRVLAQPIAWYLSWEGFFAAARWSSGVIDYPLLLALQLVVVLSMLVGIWMVGRVRLSRFQSSALKALALVYAATMLLRLSIGLIWPDLHAWFQFPLPAFFHLVIAAYLCVLAALLRPDSQGAKL